MVNLSSHLPKISITSQNMPQTSNSLLSSTNEWLLGTTYGNQGPIIMDV